MSARILRRISVMFDQAEERNARACAKYKRCADRSIIHTAIFKKGEYVLAKRPLTEAKTAKEKKDEIEKSKLRYKMTGPYKILSATPETIPSTKT